MFDNEQAEVKFAIEAVRNAALLVSRIRQAMAVSALTKNDRSPVTVADFSAQAFVGRLLQQTFPQDVLVAEEDSKALQQTQNGDRLAQVVAFVRQMFPEASAEDVCRWIDFGNAEPGSRFWTLDPIDGTKGFLRGDQYAVALALVVEGKVQIGVLGCPGLVNGYQPEPGGAGSLTVAVRGQGTWVTSLTADVSWRPLHVSSRANPVKARLLRSFERGHTNVNRIDVFTRTLGIEADPVRMDSQAKYAVLAAGHAELYLRLLSAERPDYREKIWDQAAGSLIVEEAGGMVTDLAGKALDFTRGRTLAANRGVCASNGVLHDAALEALHTMQDA